MSEQPDPGFSYASIVEDLREGGLTSSEIGRIAGVRERQVQNWAAGTSKPLGETRDRLVDIHYVLRLLLSVYRAEGADIWLHARNPNLGGERPIDLLTEGQFAAVLDAVHALREGVG